MMVVLAHDQEVLLRQMAADLDLPPEELLVHLVSDRLEMLDLSLWKN
jgi:hypothetical protein